MKKIRHKNHNRVFTVLLMLMKKESKLDSDSESSILLGFKIRKLVEKLRESEGFWMPPGGRLKRSDKSLKHCAQREVFEEVGIFVPLRSMIKVATLNVVHTDGQRYALVHFYMVTKEKWDIDGLIRNGREMKNVDFYPLSDVFSRKFKMLPYDKRWLKHAVEGTLVEVRIVIGDGRTDVREFFCKRCPRSA